MKKLKKLTIGKNYLYLKFPLANLKTLSGVLVGKTLLENVLVQTLVLLLSFSDILIPILCSSKCQVLQASLLLLFYL